MAQDRDQPGAGDTPASRMTGVPAFTSGIVPARPGITDCLEAAMRADPSLTVEDAIRTVPVSEAWRDAMAAAVHDTARIIGEQWLIVRPVVLAAVAGRAREEHRAGISAMHSEYRRRRKARQRRKR